MNEELAATISYTYIVVETSISIFLIVLTGCLLYMVWDAIKEKI